MQGLWHGSVAKSGGYAIIIVKKLLIAPTAEMQARWKSRKLERRKRKLYWDPTYASGEYEVLNSRINEIIAYF